ncbi:hypothetical protein F2Q69_00034518 [Brassica cretica]|uniref:Uncharacterized protein n=1 Tax=Brassica cretica TaxID=69181 RepID=A0A8S9SF17_BRACR|nr:hypothetical protein F2Q69_00034518 [Brassica cretica]
MNLNSGKHGLSLLRSSGDSIRRFDENAWIDVRPSGTNARSLRSDRALTRARSLRSDRALARTWLLRSDRTACMRGNYATVELVACGAAEVEAATGDIVVAYKLVIDRCSGQHLLWVEQLCNPRFLE